MTALNYIDDELHTHVANGDVAKVKKALQKGANINAKDDQNATPLVVAVCFAFLFYANVGFRSKLLHIVRELLNHKDVDVNFQGKHRGPLAWAGEFEHLDFFCEILKHPKIDVNALDTCSTTVLMRATINGRTDIVKMLLNHDKINVNVVNKDGDTALIMACSNCDDDDIYMETINELLQDDMVDVNVKNEAGFTALMMASANGSLDLVRNLVEHVNIDLNAHDAKGRTALSLASHEDHWDVVEALIRKDVDVNTQGPLGYTSLLWATVRGRKDAVSMLLKHKKVDANVKNKAGSTALDIARICELHDIVRLLKEHDDQQKR